MPSQRRIAKRKQQMSLPMRRQLGYQAPGKKEDKRTVLLTEDITEALTDVSRLHCSQLQDTCINQFMKCLT